MRRTVLLAYVAAVPLLLVTAAGALAATATEGPLLAQAGAMGILKVDCNMEGATVLVEGDEVGVTPLMTAVAAGDHDIVVKLDGYSRFTQTVNIPADKKLVVSAEIELIAGTIVLDVQPDGATILLDGTEMGVTPTLSKLEMVDPGKHQVTVRKSGYGEVVEAITLQPRSQITVSVALEATSGVLVVSTVPDGATVFADGEELGTTPLTVADMDIGLHTLRLTSEGHADAFVSADVLLGQQADIEHVFSTEYGALRIIPNPGDALVTVNNYPIGTGRQELSAMAPGVHKVEVTAGAYLDYGQDVLVHAGRTQTVRASLPPTNPAGAAARTPRERTPRVPRVRQIDPDKAKKAAPVVVAIVGAVTTGTVIAIAAATTEGPEPVPPVTDYTFQLP